MSNPTGNALSAERLPPSPSHAAESAERLAEWPEVWVRASVRRSSDAEALVDLGDALTWVSRSRIGTGHLVPAASGGAEQVELAARAISVSCGEDPDDTAPISGICGPHNEPLPQWKLYEEQAIAVLSALASGGAAANRKEVMPSEQDPGHARHDNSPQVMCEAPGGAAADLARVEATPPAPSRDAVEAMRWTDEAEHAAWRAFHKAGTKQGMRDAYAAARAALASADTRQGDGAAITDEMVERACVAAFAEVPVKGDLIWNRMLAALRAALTPSADQEGK